MMIQVISRMNYIFQAFAKKAIAYLYSEEQSPEVIFLRRFQLLPKFSVAWS
jgi:hypothetical protein